MHDSAMPRLSDTLPEALDPAAGLSVGGDTLMDEETRRHLLALAQMLAPHIEGCCEADRWLVQCAVSELDRLCTAAPLYSPSATLVRLTMPGEPVVVGGVR